MGERGRQVWKQFYRVQGTAPKVMRVFILSFCKSPLRVVLSLPVGRHRNLPQKEKEKIYNAEQIAHTRKTIISHLVRQNMKMCTLRGMIEIF